MKVKLEERHLDAAIAEKEAQGEKFHTACSCFVALAVKEQIPGFMSCGFSTVYAGESKDLYASLYHETTRQMDDLVLAFDRGHYEYIRLALQQQGGTIELEFEKYQDGEQ